MRLIPRLSSKQKVWPGGPELGQIVQAQLTPPDAPPPAIVPPIGPPPPLSAPPAPQAPAEAELLLVLR